MVQEKERESEWERDKIQYIVREQEKAIIPIKDNHH